MYFKNNFYSDRWDKFVVITVATEDNAELSRFKNSCDLHNIPYIILGLGDQWKSGNAKNGVLLEPGGAQKIIYLRDELKKWPTLEDHIILFTDSYDVVFFEGVEEILQRFRSTNSQILFSTEKTCWPDESLENDYPIVDTDYRFLNSGGFIGYANQVFKIIDTEIPIDYDDQLFYTEKFFDYMENDVDFIKLDYKREIFQTLNMAIDDVEFVDKKCINVQNGKNICVLHANGPSWIKKYLTEKTFDLYQYTEKDKKTYDKVLKKVLDTNKVVQWSVFIQHDIKDVNQIFDHIRIMDYPKEKIILHLVYNNHKYEYQIDKFIKKFGLSFKKVIVEFNDRLLESRKNALDLAQGNCDFLILMDSNHIFRNNKSIQLLITKNLPIVTPMILEEKTDWANFGIYPQFTRDTIYNYETKNHFVVNYAYGVYVIQSGHIDQVRGFLETEEEVNDQDWDNLLCANAKENKFPLYLCNVNFYGSIIN